MKKICITILSLAFLVPMAALAGVGACWQQDTNLEFFIYGTNGVDRLPEGSICQLIWTPAPTVSVVDIYRPLVPAGAGEVAVSIEGQSYSTLAPDDGEIVRPGLVLSNSYTNGYVYTRVFASAHAADIVAGVPWGQGGLSPLLMALPTNRPPLPTDYFYSCIAASTNYVLPYALTGGCEYVINPYQVYFNEYGGAGNFNVVANSELCEWQPTVVDPLDLPSWVSVSSPAGSTNGSALVSYFVQTNYMPMVRSLLLQVNESSYCTIIQAESTFCDSSNYGWATAITNISEVGGIAAVTLNTEAPCEWQVDSDVDWIEVLSPTGWTNGSAAVSFDVAVNYAPYGRVGHLTVWDNDLTVTQEASSVCRYVVQPESTNVSRQLTAGSFLVQAPGECLWDATNDVAWIEVFCPMDSFSGTSIVCYAVAENTNKTSRTGHINVMGTLFTISQMAGRVTGGANVWFPILLEASTNDVSRDDQFGKEGYQDE